MDRAIPRDAPRSDEVDRLPRFADNAAPAAICCFLDFAGMQWYQHSGTEAVQLGSISQIVPYPSSNKNAAQGTRRRSGEWD
jgi:hypothetical protein